MTGLLIFLTMLGVGLILAEFILPGAVLGITGGLILLITAGLGWYYYPDLGIYIAVGELTLLLLGVAVGFYLISSTNLGGVMVLKSQQTVAEGYASPSQEAPVVGELGEVISALRPAGWITIDGRRVSAVADGAFIPKGAQVRVIEVEGQRVVVELADVPAGDPVS